MREDVPQGTGGLQERQLHRAGREEDYASGCAAQLVEGSAIGTRSPARLGWERGGRGGRAKGGKTGRKRGGHYEVLIISPSLPRTTFTGGLVWRTQ